MLRSGSLTRIDLYGVMRSYEVLSDLGGQPIECR